MYGHLEVMTYTVYGDRIEVTVDRIEVEDDDIYPGLGRYLYLLEIRGYQLLLIKSRLIGPTTSLFLSSSSSADDRS